MAAIQGRRVGEARTVPQHTRDYNEHRLGATRRVYELGMEVADLAVAASLPQDITLGRILSKPYRMGMKSGKHAGIEKLVTGWDVFRSVKVPTSASAIGRPYFEGVLLTRTAVVCYTSQRPTLLPGNVLIFESQKSITDNTDILHAFPDTWHSSIDPRKRSGDAETCEAVMDHLAAYVLDKGLQPATP
jgi:hypothetical protein